MPGIAPTSGREQTEPRSLNPGEGVFAPQQYQEAERG